MSEAAAVSPHGADIPGALAALETEIARWARYYEQVSQPHYAHLDIAWMAAHLEGLRTARRLVRAAGCRMQDEGGRRTHEPP